jgi:hypothetical protein
LLRAAGSKEVYSEDQEMESGVGEQGSDKASETGAHALGTTDDMFGEAMRDAVDFEEDRVYYVVQGIGFLVGERVPAKFADDADLHFFDIDALIRYFPFCDDFGPYNLGSIFRFLELMGNKLRGLPGKTVVLCCRPDRRAITNAGFLLGAYMILELGFLPDSPLMPLSNVKPTPYDDFRDATFQPVTFGLNIRDAWRGLHKAFSLRWCLIALLVVAFAVRLAQLALLTNARDDTHKRTLTAPGLMLTPTLPLIWKSTSITITQVRTASCAFHSADDRLPLILHSFGGAPSMPSSPLQQQHLAPLCSSGGGSVGDRRSPCCRA